MINENSPFVPTSQIGLQRAKSGMDNSAGRTNSVQDLFSEMFSQKDSTGKPSNKAISLSSASDFPNDTIRSTDSQRLSRLTSNGMYLNRPRRETS